MKSTRTIISEILADRKNNIKRRTPSVKQLEKWEEDGTAKATDGCTVEPDGLCEHGCKSWLLVVGMI